MRSVSAVANLSRWNWQICLGLLVGAAIAFIDNYALGGEVSPILIVLLLLITGLVAGALWGLRGALFGISAWVWVPLSHAIKHALKLADTIQPNTYLSIVYMGAFTLLIWAVGLGGGCFVRRFAAEGK